MKKKIISILFALVLVLSFSLVMAVPAAAQLDEVWVDDGFIDEAAVDAFNPALTLGTDAFATIQAGVDAVDPDGTVNVADGNYNATTDNSTQDPENTGWWWFVTISESLDLIGQSRDGVILDGTALQGEVRSTGIWVSASNVTVKNLTIQNFKITAEPETACYGLYVMEKFRDYVWENVAPLQYVTAENLKAVGNVYPLYFMKTEYATVKDCVIEDSGDDGIWVSWGSHHATVQGNTVTNSGDHGIWVGKPWFAGPGSNDAKIIDNPINGAREGGISFVASDGAIISGNTITNVAAEGWSVGALSLKDGCSNVAAFNNNIYGNDGAWNNYNGTGHGIGIDGTPSSINLFLNNIYDNSGDGCHNYSTVAVNARNNWWGDPSGPSGVGPGTGDEVSTYVDFAPWLSGGPGAYAWIDEDLDSAFDLDESHFTTIQAAIGSAISGDTISVTAGTYNETVVIPTDLTLEGAQVGVDPTEEGARIVPTEESTVIGAVRIKASDIIVDGFRIEGTVYVDDSASAITDAMISNNYITGASYGIRVGTVSNKVISQLIIEYNAIIDNANKGICFWKVDWQAGNLHDVTIRDNTISGNVGGGISTYGAGPYFVVDNTVTGNQGNGISLKYDDGDVITGNIVEDNDAMGINMHQVTNCTVEDNTVSGQVSEEVVTTFWGDPVTAGKGSGIYLHEVSTGNTIRYNKITGNNNGVLISDELDGGQGAPSGNSITYNNIAGNFYSGVLNALVDPPSPVDATYNWWDHETGPDHATLNPGAKGDSVSDNVLFSPWLYKTKAIVVTKEPAYAQSVVLDNTGAYGWNTFSAPIYPDGYADNWALLITLTGLDYSVAYRFDSDIQEFVNLTKTDDVYAITPGEGFFIKMNSAGSLPILYNTAENLILPSRPLTVGFNLIGLASMEDMLVEDAFFSLAGEGQVVSPTGNVEPGAVLVGDTVYVGEAYWAYMLGEETLVGFTTTPVNWVP